MFCTVVSKEPLIIHGYTFGHGLFIVRRLVPFLCPPKNGHVHFVLTQDWELHEQRIRVFSYYYHRYTNKYKWLRITILANEESQLEKLLKHGICCELCNQNAFLDEKLYTIYNNKKIYNAVINAHMSSYKRIELAKKINSCCLITYFTGESENFEYEKRILALPEKKGECPNLICPQFDGKVWQWYNIDQICEIYAQSRCGLILSAEEGACFAATEYLLCGLPVVTTPSVGGREAFFDPDYVVWTEPTPEAVAEAVQKAISLPISPQEIRERTLAKMKKVRETYCDILSSLAREDGIERDFRSEWNSFFVNKMMEHYYKSDSDVINYLHKHGLSTQYPFLYRLHTAHRTFRIWWDHLRGKR